jgi:hypothetical protein
MNRSSAVKATLSLNAQRSHLDTIDTMSSGSIIIRKLIAKTIITRKLIASTKSPLVK